MSVDVTRLGGGSDLHTYPCTCRDAEISSVRRWREDVQTLIPDRQGHLYLMCQQEADASDAKRLAPASIGDAARMKHLAEVTRDCLAVESMVRRADPP